MGWIAACVLLGMLLPILGMVYLDVLQVKQEAKQQIEKMEKLRKEVEKEKRDGTQDRPK
jgi:cell division protein FtsB